MRNVLITGASRGIGAAAARLFAENGDRVFLNYRHSQEAVRKLCEELTAQGGEVYPIQADVSDSQAVKTMFDTLHSNGISIDVLVNNAGIAQTKLFTDLTDEDWHTMINTNLSSVFYCCRAALPDMIRRHNGRIINITSIWGQIGGSCEVHYSAAKAGIIGLTKALAKEEGLSGDGYAFPLYVRRFAGLTGRNPDRYARHTGRCCPCGTVFSLTGFRLYHRTGTRHQRRHGLNVGTSLTP